ncbi:MAG: putative hydrolase YxeP [Actinomycetota bacterium]|jgi:hippurate hydrolase
MSEPEILSRLAEEAMDHQSGAVALRRTLHEWPEIGNHLPVTRDNVLEALEGLPLGITLHETTSGIAATLEGEHPGPTMLLRGDMDALPMPEDTGLDFASRVDGAMHACGHDTHVAMLVGAARLLADHRSDIHGRVLFMFQPGEEGHHGAQHMIDEGLLDIGPLTSGAESPITGAFAIHTTSSLPTGFVSSRGGPLMASSDSFSIRLIGKGGHGSEPFRTLDPVPAACELVQALQSMVTRRINVFNPSVLSVTQLRAGTASNVIPEVAEIGGTIRAISEATRTAVHDGIKRVAEGIAAAHDLQVEIDLHIGYDVTVNDHDYASIAAGLVRNVVGRDRFVELPNPVMGAEDFGVVLERIPGAMVFLGATPHDRNPATAAPNHSNRVFYDEDAMSTGIALYSAAALRHLQPA